MTEDFYGYLYSLVMGFALLVLWMAWLNNDDDDLPRGGDMC